ncbi:hypothetical protein VZQ01_06775 [Myxococcus faecalis]|uniref:hypothetical protein n=1 Tax=Myxococcus faecalis TaxID=3115646 RepID=UPI003CFB25CD
MRELAQRIGALPVPSGVSHLAAETSLRDAVQAQERPAAAPQRKVGDAHIDLTLDASDVTGKLDQLDERLGKTLALADRVADIVTLGDLAAAINAASSVLGVLTGPDSWADTATRQRATEATLSLVTRAEQLARGA